MFSSFHFVDRITGEGRWQRYHRGATYWMLYQWNVFGWRCMVFGEPPFDGTERWTSIRRNANGKLFVIVSHSPY